MSAATEHDFDQITLVVGDLVFISPDDRTADHLRGIQGVVLAVNGSEAQIRHNATGQILRVEVSSLRRDRRRPRVAARWEIAS